MDKIRSIKAREILDSRGNPTVEVVLRTERVEVVSSVPSGASTGSHEAVELRDGDDRYHGKGVLKAVANVNDILASELEGKDVLDQRGLDDLMIKLDGTENKSRLGANAILPVSTAVCRAAAASIETPLYRYISRIGATEAGMPEPSFNIINGGAHAGNDLAFQEFMILPSGKSFKERLRKASEKYHDLKARLEGKYSSLATNVGDEGGFAPPIGSPEEALDLIPKDVSIALDIAADGFFKGGEYDAGFKIFSKNELLEYYLGLIDRYPITSIEDPFAEDEWDSWKELTSKVPSDVLIIGDDLLATNLDRIRRAGESGACNAMILKLNQIGTVSEGLEAARSARDLGWKIMVSHRSGETTDDFIADFSVGIGADHIKSGAPARGERVVKYNRLLAIEEELSS